MRTFPVVGDDGVQRGFEIEHVYVSLASLRRLLSSIEGVSNIEQPCKNDRGIGVRLDFSHRSVRFHVWEPYGDNSRYWIGPKEQLVLRDPALLRELEDAFRAYRPPFIMKVLGDLLSLNLRGLLGAD